MKAVIMAGGEGSRLRPMTCTAPKPMARILGKPIIEYVFDNLISGGVTHAAVTLGYMPHIIENAYESGYKNLKLDFIREDSPLGTAGSVRNAAADFDEPFIVVSADAMCDFDIEKIMRYHKASGAAVTIVATDVEDPREFGVLKVGKDNRICGFVEKPSWDQAVSTLSNTGVYVINPECLKLIPNGKKYDFASDLFPLMLRKNMPIYCYHTVGYWCDVGNIQSYLKCQRDAFDGRFSPPVNGSANGIYATERLPDGDYTIIPPVYIGENSEISDGAVIGPYAVIDDNCYVGENARIRRSVVLENSSIARETSVTGAVICSGAALKKGAAMFEGSVAGSGSIVGENASIKPDVLVWPGKIVGAGAIVSANVKYGNMRADFMSENGIDDNCGAVIDAQLCLKLGYALSNSKSGKRVGVSSDSSKKSILLKNSVCVGLADGGSEVWDFGECFESQFEFLVNLCGLDSGIFISDSKRIFVCEKNGMPVCRSLEREIESGVNKCEFRSVGEKSVKKTADMSGVKALYEQELLKILGTLNGVSAKIKSENKKITDLFGRCFDSSEKSSTVFEVDYSGRCVFAETENGIIGYEKLLAICCRDEMKKGKDVAMPYTAPDYLDSIAAKYGQKVLRYVQTPIDNSDDKARLLASKQRFSKDALFLCAKLFSIMNERGITLDMLAEELPEKYIEKKTFAVNFPPSKLYSVIGDEAISSREGIKLLRKEGLLLVIPQKRGDSIKVFAEADTMETARELCFDIEEKIRIASY